jgi:hypothetical protein
MREEKDALGRLISLPACSSESVEIAIVSSEVSHQARAPVGFNAGANTVDACSEMFKFCKQCDEKYLQPRKIQCLFDVDSGPIHRGTLRIVCEVMEILLADIAQSGVCHSAAASLTVTLKRHHGVWMLALTERRIAALRHTARVRRLTLVRSRAQMLGATCRVHETAEGFITALLFDCAAVAGGANNNPRSTAIH